MCFARPFGSLRNPVCRARCWPVPCERALDEHAAPRGITLTWSDKHWFSIHVFRKAFRLLKEAGLPRKMLACSMREGPLVGGTQHFWDVEKIAGDIVYTMPSYVLEPLFNRCGDMV